jgi:hypothetical protein
MENFYQYETCCVNIDRKDVNKLCECIDNAKEITYNTFKKYIGLEQVKSLMDDFGYTGSGLHIKNDYHVAYFKSKFKGKKCVYVTWSAIEYIFTETNF